MKDVGFLPGPLKKSVLQRQEIYRKNTIDLATSY